MRSSQDSNSAFSQKSQQAVKQKPPPTTGSYHNPYDPPPYSWQAFTQHFNDLRERLGIFGKFKRFCQACTRSFLFWFAVAFFAVLEPFFCAQRIEIGLQYSQAAILAISTVLYIIQLIGVATAEWEKILLIEAMANFRTISISNTMKDFTILKLFVFFTAEGEYILEGVMIILGWILIFWRPGLATLRCFRVFRLLW
jgi:hypothetical protein